MPSISELADCISIDDVTDVFYRSFCYSSFPRGLYDDKSHIESHLDDLLESSLIEAIESSIESHSSNPSVSFICKALKIAAMESASDCAIQLQKLLNDNAALLEHLNNQGVITSNLKTYIQDNDNKSLLYQTIWQCMGDLLQGGCRNVFTTVFNFSEKISFELMEKSENKNIKCCPQQIQKISLYNALPILILLLQANTEIERCNEAMINNQVMLREHSIVEPNGDIILSFLIFDEFIKPHVLESIDPSYYQFWLNAQNESKLNPIRIFQTARTEIILKALEGDNMLTSHQRRQFAKQETSSFRIRHHENQLIQYRDLLKRLLV